MDNEEKGFSFIVPRLYDGLRLYQRSANAWLLAAVGEQVLINTVTGRGLVTRGGLPPGPPDLALKGAAGVLFDALERERDPEVAGAMRKAWEEGC